MARLGYGGLANTGGASDFTGKDPGTGVDIGYRFRSNDFNRRRFGGLWGVAMIILALLGARYG